MIQDDEELLMSTSIIFTTTARIEPSSTIKITTTTISTSTQPTSTTSMTTLAPTSSTTTTSLKPTTSSIITILSSQAALLAQNTSEILRDAQTTSTMSTTSTSTTTTITTTTTTTAIPTTTYNYEGICDDVFEAGMFKEDPFVCNNYIRCNHGVAQIFVCPKNTVWDSQNKICLWTQQVECAERELITEKTPFKANNKKKTKKTTLPKTTTEITTTEPITTTNNKRSKNPKINRKKIFI